jgi:drug/metabolite transporter (DMT)-like permease
MFARLTQGPLLVGFAAFLWATDALVRYPAIDTIDPTFIVFIEHLLGVLILAPWVYYKHRKQAFALSPKEWASAIFCGIGGSALAMLFFTASFLYVNPSVAVLLQKLQPVVVVVIAYLFLSERPSRKFFIWGSIALAAGIVLSFPDFNFKFLSKGMDLHSKGIQYALAAAVIWAASTVAGKILVNKTPPALATFWRFFFGFIALSIIILITKAPQPWHLLQPGQSLNALLYISLVPGLLAMLFYYAGLAKTSASVTTFIELAYPIGAVILNTIFLKTPLDPVQTVAGAILVLAVTLMSH